MIIDLKLIRIRYEFRFKSKSEEQGYCLLYIKNFCILASVHSKHYGWFRLFGIGLKFKNEELGLSFSERNGYRKYIKIGRWFVGYLPYNKD
jgi:hypothetical protein